MNYTATCHADPRNEQLNGADHGEVNPVGVVAAALWAVGLIAGIVALATGHGAAATVILSFAVMAPWVGLAWVSRSQPLAARSGPVRSLSGGRELQLTAH